VTPSLRSADCIVIGAGIAGASAAYELCHGGASVLLLEAEGQPGYHSTGRSAALYCESRGNAVVRALARASRAFFEAPPSTFEALGALLAPARGALHIAREEQRKELAAAAEDLGHAFPGIHLRDSEFARQQVPALRPETVHSCLWDPDAREIDVHALLDGYLRGLRRAGGELVTGVRVSAMARSDSAWRVRTAAGDFAAGLVVNAAGAWADEVGALAGATRIGLTPRRRNASILRPAGCGSVRDWSVVFDVGGQFYFKPDVDHLLVSPEDEQPSLPCDARPDETAAAVAVDRIGRVADLEFPTKPIANWAGLRSFVDDEAPVVGPDTLVDGFIWVAAQGGSGIKTAPAIARCVAALAARRPLPDDVAAAGVRVSDLTPERLGSK
jgi:D-arginine dehydrogenase